MSDKKNVPKIRFPGFTEPWEQRKLEDIYGSIGNAFVGTATPYYVESGHFYLESNNIKDGQINHNTEVFINDEFYEKQKDKWLHTGDMVMVQSGHVGHAAVIPEELNNSAAHALIMFRNPKKEIEPYFLNYQYQTLKSKKKIENITTGNTIKHILASEMQQFEVDMPELAEQKKIAEYFRALDHLITLHQRKLEHVKKMKKSMLQKMFPKKNQLYPEVRFPGFTDAWEQRKLGEIATFINGRAYSQDELLNSGKYKVLRVGNFYTNDFWYYSDMELDDKYYAENGDLLYTWSATFGPHIWHGNKVIYHYHIWKIELSKALEKNFALQLLERDKQAILSDKNGSTMVHITKAGMERKEVLLPKNIVEQVKIGQYFTNIDHLITLHQRELDHLQLLKKGMLQQMFI